MDSRPLRLTPSRDRAERPDVRFYARPSMDAKWLFVPCGDRCARRALGLASLTERPQVLTPGAIQDRSSYDRGSTAQGAFDAFREDRSDPHFTVDATIKYQHLDTGMAARALRNRSGGVQTNRESAIQIEVVGFAHRGHWRFCATSSAALRPASRNTAVSTLVGWQPEQDAAPSGASADVAETIGIAAETARRRRECASHSCS